MATANGHVWKFGKRSTALQVVAGHNLEGKYAVVTGANTGIGLETARALVSAHCHVVLACRDMTEAKDAVDKLKHDYPDAKVEAIRLELASFSEVKKFADAYLQKGYPLHLLILNAGIICDDHQLTVDGYELTYQTNHLAQMYLTQLLEATLVSSAPSRVVVVSSYGVTFEPENELTTERLNVAFFRGEAKDFNGFTAYLLSKCMNVLYTRQLSKRLRDRGVTAYVVHPGLNNTLLLSQVQVGRNFLNNLDVERRTKLEKTLGECAATPVFCAVEKDLEQYSGEFFSDCQLLGAELPAWLTNEKVVEHFWTLSEDSIAKRV